MSRRSAWMFAVVGGLWLVAGCPADWKVYGHVYKNALGGVNVQYWYFFPYNDGPSGFNHESDREHINVRLAADYSVSGVHFAHHSNVTYYAKAEVQWHGTTHPVVWIADGSHASYKSGRVGPPCPPGSPRSGCCPGAGLA